MFEPHRDDPPVAGQDMILLDQYTEGHAAGANPWWMWPLIILLEFGILAGIVWMILQS